MMRSLLERWDPTLFNIDAWPTVDEQGIPPNERQIFGARRAAILTLIETHGDMRRACEAGALSSAEVARILKRCLSTLRDGTLAGLRGCLPWFRIKPYRRTTDSGHGSAGLLGQLFQRYPEIESKLRNFALRRGNRLDLPAEVGMTALRNKLLSLCRDAGMGPHEYPLRTNEKAIRSLPRWRNRLLEEVGRSREMRRHPGEVTTVTTDGNISWIPDVDPHTIWVFDEYTIDAFASIEVLSDRGPSKWVPISRYKIISARRRGSGDIICCWATKKVEIDFSDFLEALELAIRPHQRLEISVSGLEYPSGSCFASELTPCEWLLPNLVLLDRSLVHLANATREALTTAIGSTVFFGLAHQPKTRHDIEAWHAFLAAEFRKLASTVGTGPSDPRRNSPESAAVKLRVTPQHLEQVLEIAVARFNSLPHAEHRELNGGTPIESLYCWATSRNTVARQLPEKLRPTFELAERRVSVSLVAERSDVAGVALRYKYAVFTGPHLRHSRGRIGERVVFVFNPLLAHVGRVYSESGDYIDTVMADGAWQKPHTIYNRISCTRRGRRGKAHRSVGESPMDILRKHLVQEAFSNKRAALELARVGQADAGEPAVSCDKEGDSDSAEQPEPHQPSRRMKAAGKW